MEKEIKMFKICPLFAISPRTFPLNTVPGSDQAYEHMRREIGCMEDRCSWWGADACMVVELSVIISITLRHLETLVEKGEEKNQE